HGPLLPPFIPNHLQIIRKHTLRPRHPHALTARICPAVDALIHYYVVLLRINGRGRNDPAAALASMTTLHHYSSCSSFSPDGSVTSLKLTCNSRSTLL